MKLIPGKLYCLTGDGIHVFGLSPHYRKFQYSLFMLIREEPAENQWNKTIVFLDPEGQKLKVQKEQSDRWFTVAYELK